MNAWEYIPKPLEITPGLDLRDLEALFHDLTKRYTSFHVDCDHTAQTFSAYQNVKDFLNYCQQHPYGRVMHNGLDFYSWGSGQN